jgi:hypothetical protein
VNGLPLTGNPLPYRRTAETPHLGVQDASDDIRGGMGLEGLAALVTFVEAGGTLIVEASTLELLAAYGIAAGITVETPSGLFIRGSVVKGTFSDPTSPLAYGYDGPTLPVYFNQGPVVRVGDAGGADRSPVVGGQTAAPFGMNLTPNAQPPPLTTIQEVPHEPAHPSSAEVEQFQKVARTSGVQLDGRQARVVLRFPDDPGDILLSGGLAGGQALAGRALAVDLPVGQGHIVMFATRPFWRAQTQGSYFLVFNALLHWNDLRAGAEAATDAKAPTSGR